MVYSFDLASFIGFMMIQSNVNARIDAGERKEEAVYQWFRETLSPIFHGEKQGLVLKGIAGICKKKRTAPLPYALTDRRHNRLCGCHIPSAPGL